MSEALASLKEQFGLSELASTDALTARGLTLVKSEQHSAGSLESGEFVANYTLYLKRGDGKSLAWTLEINYSRFTKVSAWKAMWSRQPTRSSHNALIYSFVKYISPDRPDWEEYIYGITEEDLSFTLEQLLSPQDLNKITQIIVSQAGACVQDLFYVIENDVFSRIVDLARSLKEPLDANPFKE